jgi:biopolymer transport protein ExbD
VKFGRRLQEESDTIPLAPLIDIVFLTLVFFMTTTVFGALESEIDITLPTADAAEVAERTQGEIFINLRQDGSIVLNGREVTIPELQETLYRVAEIFPGGSVIIRGDQQAHLGQAIAILNCCKRADIPNVSFAAVQGDAEPADAS